MLVDQSNVHSVLKHLETQGTLALDTETTGLRAYHGDKAFCVIIADADRAYVFDLGHWDPAWRPNPDRMRELFAQPRIWMAANAKFDMAMIENEYGVELAGHVHDLQAVERVLDSTLFGSVFNLGAIAARYGTAKSKAVDAYIKEKKLWTELQIPGRKGKLKLPHFDLVPKLVMAPYAEIDGKITRSIGCAQLLRVRNSEDPTMPSLKPLYDMETALTKVVYRMERRGVAVDLGYCELAVAEMAKRRAAKIEEFESLAGCRFVDSAKTFLPLFAGEKLKKTKKGAPSFDADSLATYKNPVAEIVLEIRDLKSKGDYFGGFIYHADKMGRIHASFNQHQARTGRFSSSQPNLQNMTRPEKGELAAADAYTVRRAIKPGPGKLFVMLDYDQVEFRLLLELAGAEKMCAKVVGGLDVHEATAQVAGCTRQHAKVVNFLTVYGGGAALLAERLGKTRAEAEAVRRSIFDAEPAIETFIRDTITWAEEKGIIWTWFGRRLGFPDRNLTYVAPNHRIQGGCADIIKLAMVQVEEFLRDKDAEIVLPVHDELVLEVDQHADVAAIAYGVRDIMERIYPSRLLPLTVGIDHSFVSLADKIEGVPS